MHLGPYIKDVRKIAGIFDPLPPLVSILDQSIVLKSRNLPYCVRIWATPSLPLSSDVICEWPQIVLLLSHSLLTLPFSDLSQFLQPGKLTSTKTYFELETSPKKQFDTVNTT